MGWKQVLVNGRLLDVQLTTSLWQFVDSTSCPLQTFASKLQRHFAHEDGLY